jgi:hypothetical protein
MLDYRADDFEAHFRYKMRRREFSVIDDRAYAHDHQESVEERLDSSHE